MIVHIKFSGGGAQHMRGVAVIRDYDGRQIEIARAGQSPVVYTAEQVSWVHVDMEGAIASSVGASLSDEIPPAA